MGSHGMLIVLFRLVGSSAVMCIAVCSILFLSAVSHNKSAL